MESLCVQYEIHRRKPQKGRKFPTQQFMKFASMLWMHKKQTNQIATLHFFHSLERSNRKNSNISNPRGK